MKMIQAEGSGSNRKENNMKLALTPCMIGSCKVKNRFVMTAANLGWCENGFVTEKVVDFYRERARGQVGLIIAGAAGVDPVRVNQTGMMQIYDDRFIAPMKKLTKAVHQEGGKIFLQLMHAGAYARQDEHRGQKAVAPSEYVCNFTREKTEALTAEEIRRIISYFRDGALRAKAAGFDGVELIGSAGYLIAEFLSKAVNHRTDAYGRGLVGRTRFLQEILDAVREAVGEEYPIMVRLSGADFIPGGNGPEDAAAIAGLIEKKADAINITGGWHESQVPQITYNVPDGMYLYLARTVKETVSIPVVGCNRLSAAKAAQAIENGSADMAGILRGLIADPYLVKKYQEEREDAIRPCLSCNQECLDAIFSGGGIGCAVNPAVGREGELSCFGEAAPRRLLVIGAGISGMVFSILAAQQGYEVTVWEKSSRYGGAGNAVAAIPNREAVQQYMDYLFRKCIRAGVKFCWHKEAMAEDLQEILAEGTRWEKGRAGKPDMENDAGEKPDKGFDKVIFASGAGWGPQVYEQSEDAKVYAAEECIRIVRREGVLPGRNIVVIGSGYKAVQTAQFCAAAVKTGDKEQQFLERFAPEQVSFANNIMRWGKPTVTLLAPGGKAGGGFGKSTRWMMLKEIKEMGVKVETRAEVKQILAGRVIYAQAGEEKTAPADMIVMAQGWKPGILPGGGPGEKKRSPQPGQLSGREEAIPASFTKKVIVIGDAKKPGRISEAVNDAFHAAMTLKEGNDV